MSLGTTVTTDLRPEVETIPFLHAQRQMAKHGSKGFNIIKIFDIFVRN